jgi:serine/threonine-protein phosphatase 2A regulatory subunit A
MEAAHGGTLEDNLILTAFGPLFESFLQDEFHEVQLQVLTNLHKISHLLPGLSGVVTALMQMSKATNWRVREAVAQLLPHLAEARGMDFFVSVLLEPAWLTLVLDSVASVRLQTLLPHHMRIYNQNATSYLIRNTILQGHLEALKEGGGGGALQEELLRQVVRGLTDKVANVRMVSANGLPPVLNQGPIAQALKPHLEEMAQNDTDADVRHACQTALESIV